MANLFLTRPGRNVRTGLEAHRSLVPTALSRNVLAARFSLRRVHEIYCSRFSSGWDDCATVLAEHSRHLI